MPSAPLRIGARKSPLARTQADHVARLLAASGVRSEFVGITTRGDVDRRALTEIGGTGVFAAAVRDALRAGEIDVAVHSLKDLPTADDPDLEVAAVPAREDTRDVLVGRRLADLTDGVRIGTGAPRRALQLAELGRRTGLRVHVVDVRGNVGTRLDLVARGEVDAVVLAAAGLRRLGLLGGDGASVTVGSLPAEILEHAVMLPAPGQGALALEVARNPARPLAAIRDLDHPRSHAECLVERGFLATLEAGCTAPVGARADVGPVRDGALDLTLDAVIGRTLLSTSSARASASDPAPGPGAGIGPETPPGNVPLRTRVRATSPDPRRFGADVARGVLLELQFPQRLGADPVDRA